MGIDNATNHLVLTISDHLPWDTDGKHLLLLQTKLNTHLAFIESGEIYKARPDGIGRQIDIAVVLKHEPGTAGRDLLARAQSTIEAAGHFFHFHVLTESDL